MRNLNSDLRIFYILIILALLIGISGWLLNKSVIISNGFKMPVSLSELNRVSNSELIYYESDEHFSYDKKEEIKLWFLSDIFGRKLKDYRFEVASIGDYLIDLGYICFVTIILFMGIYLVKFGLKIKIHNTIKRRYKNEN